MSITLISKLFRQKSFDESSKIIQNIIFDLQQQKCFPEKDYKHKLHLFNQAMDLLLHNKHLTYRDIVLLSNISGATDLDLFGNVKIKREAYALINKNAQKLNITYSTNKPIAEEIINALKNNAFVIRDSIKKSAYKDKGITTDMLHKTMLIITERGLIAIGMHTSAKQGSIKLSPLKEADIDKEFTGAQYFVSFNYFINAKEDTIVIDLAMQGFDITSNVLDQDVIQIIMEHFEQNKTIWENNFIQEPYEITSDFLRTLSLISLKENLSILQEEHDNLISYLESLNDASRIDYIKQLESNKKTYLEQKQYQKYISSLIPEEKTMLDCQNKFEQIQEKVKLIKTTEHLDPHGND